MLPKLIADIILPDWAKKALAGAGVLAALVAAFLIWDAFDDAGVRKDVRAKDAAATAQASQAANDRAAETARINAVTNAQADQRNADAIARAQASDPAGVKRPAGPATRAVLEGLRR